MNIQLTQEAKVEMLERLKKKKKDSDLIRIFIKGFG